jgi:hypothetical protein
MKRSTSPRDARRNVRVQRDRSGEPRLPHEHDESADSQVPSSTQRSDIGRKAYDDVTAGRVDTDRGPVLEELFRKKLQPPNEPPRHKPSRRR